MSTAIPPLQKFRSSELSRQSAPVFAAAAERPVEVTRRDGESLVLMSLSESEARDRLLEIAAQLIAVATDDEGTLAERMAGRLPWMLALSPADRDACAADLIRAARASFATGQAQLAIAEMTAWQETAVAVAAGLRNAPVEWLDEPETVNRP